jgi:hypothetical protein
MSRALTAEELLAGSEATYTVAVPASVWKPSEATNGNEVREVTLRPLTVRDLQRITQAAKEQQVLTSVLMVQQALVKPKLSVEQTGILPVGLVQFLLAKTNAVSGLSVEGDDLEQAVRAPLARACFILSREFGWTPAQCSELTVGQILLYLELLARGEREVAIP